MTNETIDEKTFKISNKVAMSLVVAIVGATFWTTRFYFKTEANREYTEYVDERHDRKIKNERERNKFIIDAMFLKKENKELTDKLKNCNQLCINQIALKYTN